MRLERGLAFTVFLAGLAGLSGAGCATQALERFAQESTVFSDSRELPSIGAGMFMRSVMAPEVEPELWRGVIFYLKRLQLSYSAVAKKRGLEPIEFQVSVLDSSMVNAFSLPNGHIYMTSGLLSLLASESELAAVLAHEMAHGAFGHYRRSMDRLSIPVPGVPVAAMVFDQSREHESDRFAVELLEKSGFDPAGMASFLTTIRALEVRYGFRSGGFLSTHPATAQRIERVRTEDEVSERRSRVEFKEMKRAIQSRRQSYSPFPEMDMEPPRFRTGAIEVDRVLTDAVRGIRLGLDLEPAARRLSSLLENTKEAKPRAVILTWLGVIDLHRGRYGDASERFEQSIALAPEMETPRWYRLVAMSALSGIDKARESWKAEAERCKKDSNLECAFWSVWFASDAGVSHEESGASARYFRRLLNQKTARSQEVNDWENRALSKAMSEEIRHELHRPSDERIHELDVPKGFRPSRELMDYQRLASRMKAEGESFGYLEQGSTFSLEGGGGAYLGELGSALRSGATLSFQLGVRRWPWEFGLAFTPQLSRESGLTLGGENELRTVSGGLYARRDFFNTRLRPWVSASLHREGVYFDRDDGIRRGAISAGWTVGGRAGLALRLGGRNGAEGVLPHLKLSAGLRRSWFRPFEGVSGIGTAWDVLLGLEVLIGRVQREQSISDAVERPPVFY